MNQGNERKNIADSIRYLLYWQNMERFEFYKEQHLKEEDKKNEINNSLSLPLGVISGLVVALFYIITSFDYKISLIVNLIFLLLASIAIVFLLIATYHLIKAYTNFHNGYDYHYLPDTEELDKYYTDLDKYYNEHSSIENNSSREFKDYIISCFVKTTDKNQKNNKQKSYHRYLSLKHLINSLLVIVLVLFPFGYNYYKKKDCKDSYSVEISNAGKIIDSIKKINFIILNSSKMVDEKPTAPPTQTIKEGQEPIIKK